MAEMTFGKIRTLDDARAWVRAQARGEIRNDQIAILAKQFPGSSQELTDLAESLGVTFTGNPGR